MPSRTPILCLCTTLLALSFIIVCPSVPAQSQITIIGERPTCDQCITAATSVRVEPDAPVAIQSFENVVDTLANLRVNSGGAGSFGNPLAYRGLSNTPYFSVAAVTVYLDNIPLTGTFTLPTRLLGTDTFTLWRGSTASEFGRAGEAGTLLLTSGQMPTEARASVGNHDARLIEVSFHTTNQLLDSQFAAAVGARDGYIRNTVLNKFVDDQRTLDLTGRLRWSATSAAQFALDGFATRERDGAQPLVPLGGPLYTVSRPNEGMGWLPQ